MLARFARDGDRGTAGLVVWTCAVHAGSGADPAQLVRLAERGAVADPTNPGAAKTFGVALYRAGRYEEAIQRLTVGIGNGSAPGWLYLAQAQRAADRPDEARQWLLKALEWTEPALDPTPGRPGSRAAWDLLVVIRTLRREAEALLHALPARGATDR
jgi:hypothetical protein